MELCIDNFNNSIDRQIFLYLKNHRFIKDESKQKPALPENP
ncbi:hypothetical protein PEDI_33000 [Persicobacter diffluens]|uniref:Uncharacterized protein n=1 Tax=Persicobacter diffluens TaxID=981 RepID=A0AAN4W177_9BACT|nr:hypothetical protein PEDI_33000 [Persicobacter diffluens]